MESNEPKKRKTDRRTIYTRNVIKDALLEAMAKRNFDSVTVTEVCRLAEITRATFYLHFDSLTDVLDALLADALRIAEEETIDPNADISQNTALLAAKTPDELKDCDELLPVCHRACQLPKYKVIFRDDSITSYVVNKIYLTQKEKLAPALSSLFNIPRKDAELFTLFLINGTYSVNRALKWKKGDTWYRVHSLLMQFIAAGYSGLKNN